MITQEDRVLVQLIRLVEHIPSPPPPSARRPRGRPIFYPEKLFLKALVIMILRRLHRVGELLAVLDEPTPEMKIVRELLREEGRFPTSRTFQRRLKTLPERLPEQIGCLGRHLVEVLKPANTADNQIAPALIEQLPDEARFVLGDIHYNAPNLREACLHHSSDEERFLVTTKRGTYPHTDLMASKSVASSTSCAAWPTRTSERLTSFLYGLKPNAPQRAYGLGLGNQRGWLDTPVRYPVTPPPSTTMPSFTPRWWLRSTAMSPLVTAHPRCRVP